MKDKLAVFTVGHSTRSAQEFCELLRNFKIGRLIDVRTIPRSQHNPQFNKEILGPFLRNRGIAYRHMKNLGGLRRARADSLNDGWNNASFRGYADYMQSAKFGIAIEALIRLAVEKPTAIMCAEAVPWRCHRSLIGDALVVRGIQVIDIFDLKNAKPHLLNAMAQVQGTVIIYPQGDC
jgi:uncharacterized protein (DUF488 family)